MNIGCETEQIEFKKTTSETKEGIISIASILNKHGKGTIFFGVKDNGEVVGQGIGKDTLRNLSRDISGNIKPTFWYSIEERNSVEGKRFIEVQFSGNVAPYSAYGKYYERFADEDKAISDTELERLFYARKKDYSGWEVEKTDCSIDELDSELIKRVMQSGKDIGRIKYNSFDKENLLTKFGLLTKEKKYVNNAGKVLFSANKPVILKLATFATDTKDTFLKLNHFEGNIFECINAGIDYINESIYWDIKIQGAAARKEIPEIPSIGIREIIVNAFAHGGYASNTTFEIDVFSDRVVIYSPGLFPLGYTPEDFANNSQEPIMLNPKIVNVLFKTGMIESFGSGFNRTFLACKKNKVKCGYENTKSGFRFIFYRPHGHKNVQDMSKTCPRHIQDMSKTEKLVYEELKKNNMATAKMIAAVIGKSEKTVYRAISSLKANGKLERIGDDYNGSWLIK